MAINLNTPEEMPTPVLKVEPGVFNVKHDSSVDDLSFSEEIAQPVPTKETDHDEPEYRGIVVKVKDADNIFIGNHHYRLVYQYRDGFDAERLGQRFETILNKYDYVVGDWGFEQLRLRGFYDERHHTANRDQSIATLQDYINEYCNFGCAFFVLEKAESDNTDRNLHRHSNNRRRKRTVNSSKTGAVNAKTPKPQQNKSAKKQSEQRTNQAAKHSAQTRTTDRFRSTNDRSDHKGQQGKPNGQKKQRRSEKNKANQAPEHNNFTMHTLTNTTTPHQSQRPSETRAKRQSTTNRPRVVDKQSGQSRAPHEFHIRQLED